MAQTITLNGVDRSGVIARENVEWVEAAYLGEVGQGHAQIDDAAGTITVPGYKSATVEQSSSSPSRIFSGFTHRKAIRRGDTYQTAASREYVVSLVDGNDLLKRHVIRRRDGDTTAEGGKRPRESITERIEWLLASGFLDAFDFGRVQPADEELSASDYRGMFPQDVLEACVKPVKFNHYIRWNAAEADWELVFRDENQNSDDTWLALTDTCSIALSNDATEIETTVDGFFVLPVLQDAELSQDPEGVYSGAFGSHREGHIYRDRAATATAFAERDGITEDAGTNDDGISARDAEAFLDESEDEEQLLPVVVKASASQVGEFQAGFRIPVHMTHMDPEGWGNALDDEPRYARILRKRITQPLNSDSVYHVAMDLSPQEPGPVPAGIVQSVFDFAFEGGDLAILPNPVTVGNILVYVCSDRGVPDPVSPNYLDPDLPRMGSGAWTKVPNTTNRNEYNSGVAIWTKVADDTSNTVWLAATQTNYGIFEISGGTLTGTSTLDESLHANGLTMSLGSIGTAAAGSVCIAVIAWSDQRGNTDPSMPGVAPLSPFVTDLFDDAGHSGGLSAQEPFTWIGHALGTGAALTPSITRSAPAQLSGIWAGVALLIPPA